MRVISGSAKGHNLRCITGLDTRPTTDRVKESVFNIIASNIPGSHVLDLFSGTGNLAIESLSRGAESAVLIDSNPACVKIINQNLEHTKLSSRAKVILGDVSQIERINKKFDIIFMDPPYDKGFIIPLLNNIHSLDLLEEDGLIIVEKSKRDEICDVPFRIVREQIYGDTVVLFLKNINS